MLVKGSSVHSDINLWLQYLGCLGTNNLTMLKKMAEAMKVLTVSDDCFEICAKICYSKGANFKQWLTELVN